MHIKDEIDFKELLKNPIRLFGLSYIYFLLAGGFLGTYYIWNMNDVSKNAITPVVLKDSAQFVLDVPMQRGALIAPVNVAIAGRSSKALIDKGANLYKANCASCHGDNGMGDGLSAAALTVKPRNFHSAEGWKNGRKVSNIYKTLQDGILLSGMPAFNYTPAEDRFAIIHFIRTFATDFPVDSLSELLDLERVYNLSKGTQLPAQIPVKMALQKVTQENDAEINAVDQFCESMDEAIKNDAGAKIAMKVSRNENKIATAALAAQGRSLDDFVRIISSDPVTIGFKPEVVRLSSEEWNALYSYLSKVNRKS
ncbi:MAG: cytochrome c [Ignavibacteriales bacterium]|nr:cytochrome c [Ignavibacteriales bacterium]